MAAAAAEARADAPAASLVGAAEEPPTALGGQEASASLQALERAARSVTEDAARLVSTAHEGLHAMTLNTGQYMDVYRSAAQDAAEAVSAGVAQGRSFIARCESLDQEMEKVDALADQVHQIRQSLSQLEASLKLPPTK